MAYISFQHKDTIIGPLRRAIMAGGSGGDYVHCEIVLNELGDKVCSSWYPEGVQIRPWKDKLFPALWVNYDLGSVDDKIYHYFKEREGTPYTLTGLVVNMILNAQEITKKSFCSQICLDALRYIGTYDLPNTVSTSISPNDLKNIFDTHNFKPIKSWH